jgi:hypothetical protein
MTAITHVDPERGIPITSKFFGVLLVRPKLGLESRKLATLMNAQASNAATPHHVRRLSALLRIHSLIW